MSLNKLPLIDFASIKEPDFQHHLNEYAEALESLSDDNKAVEMLQKQVKNLDKLKSRLIQDRKAIIGKTTSPVENRKFRNLDHILGNVEHARTLLNNDFDVVIEDLKSMAKDTLSIIKSTENAPKTMADEVYSADKDRKGTIKRFYRGDKLYEISGFKLDNKTLEEQLLIQYLIPEDINIKRWTFLTSWHNSEFKMGLEKKEVELAGSGFSILANFARGTSNETMPTEFKLRHNAAIHSLHTCNLIDRVCDRVKNLVDQPGFDRINGKSSSKNIKTFLSSFKKNAIFSILMHDLSEAYLGEVSVGSDLAKMPDAKKKKFSEDRDHYEEFIFPVVSEQILDICKKHYNFLETDCIEFKKQMQRGFNIAEETQTFLGRFVKTCERLQSNLDLSRWGGKFSSVSPINTFETDKDFSLSYVMKPLFGVEIPRTPSILRSDVFDDISDNERIEKKEQATSSRNNFLREIKGIFEASLRGLIKRDEPPLKRYKIKAQEMICEQIEAEFSRMFRKKAISMGQDTEAVEVCIKNLLDSVKQKSLGKN